MSQVGGLDITKLLLKLDMEISLIQDYILQAHNFTTGKWIYRDTYMATFNKAIKDALVDQSNYIRKFLDRYIMDLGNIKSKSLTRDQILLREARYNTTLEYVSLITQQSILQETISVENARIRKIKRDIDKLHTEISILI